jgi:peptidoglycan/LPS O-acetylase OafA/YrhL
MVIRGESRSGKIDALTGLRFWAATLIVTQHAAMLRIPIPSWAFGGGVSLFFVLSSFILAYVYPQLDDWRAVQRFLVLRVARIWPAHLVMLVVWLAVIGGTVFSAPFVANLMMVQAWVPYYPWYFSFNAPSWSISTEFFFYLVFPLLIISWQRNWWWKWLAAATILAGLIAVCTLARLPNLSTEDVVTVHGLILINPLSRVFEFVTGMVAYSCFAALKPHAR